MAPRGRKPMPFEMKVANGSFIKDPNAVVFQQPKAPSDMPKPPKYIKGDARREWNWVCGKLKELGVLSSADRCVIENYVVNYVAWRECCDTIAKEGKVVEEPTKYGKKLVVSPHVRNQTNYANNMQRCLGVLGLTPAARTTLHVERSSTKVKPVASRVRD